MDSVKIGDVLTIDMGQAHARTVEVRSISRSGPDGVVRIEAMPYSTTKQQRLQQQSQKAQWFINDVQSQLTGPPQPGDIVSFDFSYGGKTDMNPVTDDKTNPLADLLNTLRGRAEDINLNVTDFYSDREVPQQAELPGMSDEEIAGKLSQWDDILS